VTFSAIYAKIGFVCSHYTQYIKEDKIMNSKDNRSSFSGKIGFVLSAAGASVGLGNIWRFPYLAAKYGGGIFLLIYILLALTFGYTMIVAESALGRMTRKSPVSAFQSFGTKKWLSFGGWINAVIPILIVPYYSVIGGWVIKYLLEYIRGDGAKLAEDGYFSAFISDGASTELCFVLFCMFTLVIIFAGVRNGVERVSKLMMPVLVVLSVIIAVYSVTRPGALAGVKYFLVPNPANFSWMTVVTAMGQMFYSLSIAMGILITFGSYMKKETSIEGLSLKVKRGETIGIIGGADGPTAIYLTSKLAPNLLGPIAVAAYSYMALVPVIQPPIMKMLTTQKEREIVMKQLRKVSKTEKIIFPIIVTVFVSLLLPSAAPLIGCLMLGNLMRESGVVERLSKTVQNELMNITTIFLGVSVGATTTATAFLNYQTLAILVIGILAFALGSAGGVLLAKFMNLFTKNKINPLIGSAGVSAVPMAARVSQTVGQEANPGNFLLMHAMGPNVAGVIGSAVAAGILLSFLG